jgi:trk system potassium uptake protein TrkH
MIWYAIKEAGKVLSIYALTLLLPLGVSVLYDQQQVVWCFLYPWVFSLILFLPYCSQPEERSVNTTLSFLILGLVWLGLILLSSVPWALYFDVPIGMVVFESASALTTSGIEVIGNLSDWPYAFVWYRQQLSWIGGVGVVILSLSLLSQYQHGIYAHHMTDFGLEMKGLGFAKRVAKSAQLMSLIYILLTGITVLAYYLSGLSLWQSLLESMTIVSTAGFSLQPAFYEQTTRKVIATVVMLLSSIGLSSFMCLFGRVNLKEAKFFIWWIISLVILVSLVSTNVPLLDTVFQVCSFASTTGIGAEVGSQPAMMLMMIAGMVGGCVGSTSGGIKIKRIMLAQLSIKGMLAQSWRPKQVIGQQESEHAVVNYILLFFVTVLLGTWVMLAVGTDFADAVLAVLSTITNVGSYALPSFYQGLTSYQSMILTALMILGRVELIAVIVLCLPNYWRQV